MSVIYSYYLAFLRCNPFHNSRGQRSARELICALKHLISAQPRAPLQHGGSKRLVGLRNSTHKTESKQLEQRRPVPLARQSGKNTMPAHTVSPIKAMHESYMVASDPVEGWDLGDWESEGWSSDTIF